MQARPDAVAKLIGYSWTVSKNLQQARNPGPDASPPDGNTTGSAHGRAAASTLGRLALKSGRAQASKLLRLAGSPCNTDLSPICCRRQTESESARAHWYSCMRRSLSKQCAVSLLNSQAWGSSKLLGVPRSTQVAPKHKRRRLTLHCCRDMDAPEAGRAPATNMHQPNKLQSVVMDRGLSSVEWLWLWGQRPMT